MWIARSAATWQSLLSEVNTTIITYDGSGNPVTYYNGYKDFTALAWEQGRQLTSVTTGGKTTTYAYDADGIRTEKGIDGVTHHYVTRGGKLMRESFLSGSKEIIMDFSYDEAGRPFAVSYSKDGGASFSTYYYAVNQQGDVVMIFGRSAVTDEEGNTTGYTVKSYGYYTYDAWGNVTAHTATGSTPASTSLIYRNPLRYRGYVYDIETGFYYLQSRYYDPANHRFINADAPDYSAMSAYSLNDSNLFAYCGNNPVSRADDEGQFWNFIVGAVVGAVVSAVTTAIDSYKTTGSIDWADVGISAVTGAATGVIAASGIGVLGQAALTAGVSAASNYIQQKVDVAQGDRNSVNLWETVGAGAIGFMTSIVGSATGKLASNKIMSQGLTMVEKGRGNVLTGVVRQCAGQSHSSLIRNGTRLVAEGTKMINIAKGVSSVVGTLSTWRYSALFTAVT